LKPVRDGRSVAESRPDERAKSHKQIGEEFQSPTANCNFGPTNDPKCFKHRYPAAVVGDVKQLASILIQSRQIGSSVANACDSRAIRCGRKGGQTSPRRKSAKERREEIFPLVLFQFPRYLCRPRRPCRINMYRTNVEQVDSAPWMRTGSAATSQLRNKQRDWQQPMDRQHDERLVGMQW